MPVLEVPVMQFREVVLEPPSSIDMVEDDQLKQQLKVEPPQEEVPLQIEAPP